MLDIFELFPANFLSTPARISSQIYPISGSNDVIAVVDRTRIKLVSV